MVKRTLGIDLGATSTKIAIFEETAGIVDARTFPCIKDSDKLELALLAFLDDEKLPFEMITGAAMTGVGAAFIGSEIRGVKIKKVSEFEAVAYGALAATRLDSALVASVGTGTSFVLAGRDGARHMGGSAMGGGTIVGLAEKMIGETDAELLTGMAERGDLGKVDLLMSDIGTAPNLPQDATASNFGKTGQNPSQSDVAIGLINLVFQNIATMAVFIGRGVGVKDIVVTGSSAEIKQAKNIVDAVGRLYGMNFIIPPRPAYITAVGTARLA